ncbi:MAG: T9SS type A sorting domain-containing protein [Rhodothermales bacterium]|nr:T9SS type A sorting domain-containing protein [Rhodothermales bacterium]
MPCASPRLRAALRLLAAVLFVTASAGPARALQSDTTEVVVDAGVRHQVMEGFGATTLSLVFAEDNLTPALRQAAIEAVYGQVQLSMGNLQLGIVETPADASDPWGQRANDDGDPFTINPDGFNWAGSVAMKERVIDLAEPLGFDNYYLAHGINVRWAMPWLKPLRETDYDRYLDEAAEHILAGLLYWRDAYGLVPRYMQPFNEPLSGNFELDGGTVREVVDIVKRAGARLRAEGFSDVLFVVPNEETERNSLDVAAALLADPEARQYVGAIGYHPYPYGSTYSSVRAILETSGRGAPDAGKIAVRNQLRSLAAQHGIPVWMTEVTQGPGNADFPFGAMENVRGRAIHIHDELVYADAAAYFGMNNMWDLRAHQEHFGGDRNFLGEQSTIGLINNETGEVFISGMGYAIGHYARWVKRGAVRIGAASSDPLLQVTAFDDAARDRIVLVLINNAETARPLRVVLQGTSAAGTVGGEQSAGTARWQPLPAFAPAGPQRVALAVPARSVTTIAIPTTSAPVGTEPPETPDGLALGPTYPNPSGGATTIPFSLPARDSVSLRVFDVLGREVETLVDGVLPAGRHAAVFDARGLPSGLYLYRLETPSGSRSGRLIVER